MEIGDKVIKKSKKPFKSGSQTETIIGFGINELNPKKRPCAIFSNGSVCNVELLNKITINPGQSDGGEPLKGSET